MEPKNRFWGWLFGSRLEDEDNEDDLEQVQEEQTAEEEIIPEEPPEPEPVINQLILPWDHPFILLYELWAEHVRDAPLPYLRLENAGVVSDSELEQELHRLRKFITAEALSRWEMIPKETKKPDEDGEELPDNEEAQEPEPVNLDAFPMVYVTSNRLGAWLMIFPPVGEGKELDRGILDAALQKSGVTFGVNTELLERLSDEPNRYFHLYRIAIGQPVVHGEDGYIEDFFERATKQKFVEDEHGRVDYFNLNLVQNVEKGGVICQAVPPKEGVPGRTVLGQEIVCKTGKAAILPKGRNTEASEDGTKLLAVKSGRVEFSGRSFVVKSVLEINGNVDFSSGNINFVGDVHIHGDVSSGFSIRTIGDVTIDGVVEAAEIEAGGDLIVAKGILGDSRAVLRAHHDIYAQYMENCTVHCRGDLKTDCIVNCDIYCDGEVQVRTGRGTMIGGRIRAARGINAKIVGSKSESVTTVYLGGQPCANYEREFLQKSLDELEAELEKVERQPNSPSKTQRMGKIRLDLSVGRMKLGQFDKELEKIKNKLEEQGGCRLKCDIAYPGLVLNINKETLHLTKETSSVVARLVNGEICVM